VIVERDDLGGDQCPAHELVADLARPGAVEVWGRWKLGHWRFDFCFSKFLVQLLAIGSAGAGSFIDGLPGWPRRPATLWLRWGRPSARHRRARTKATAATKAAARRPARAEVRCLIHATEKAAMASPCLDPGAMEWSCPSTLASMLAWAAADEVAEVDESLTLVRPPIFSSSTMKHCTRS
jgi:hypothetical protein